MSKNILAIDLGYGSIKVAYRTSAGELRYQKLVTAIAKDEKRRISNVDDENSYEYENESYYIGKKALRLDPKEIINISDYKTFKFVSPILISYYINLIQSTENVRFDTIVVGLSLAHELESGDYLKYLEDKLGLKIIILPQGISSKFTIEKYGLDPTDETQATNIKLDNYIGIDLGFNTVDVFKVIEGRSSTRTAKGYENMGVINVAENLNKYVIQKYGTELSIQNYKTILEVGSLHDRSRLINLTKEIHELTVDYLIGVINKVENDYSSEITMLDRIIMVGGGANLIQKYLGDTKLQEHINSKYPGDFLVIPKIPEFYNVIGYFTKAEGGV